MVELNPTVPEAGRAEGSDGFDHFRGQLHFLVDLLPPALRGS